MLRDGGGWLFPPGDVAALSQLLTELADDREALSRQSEEAWHVALGRDWSRLGRRLSAVLIGHDRADVLLVCSSGGHLLQLLALREAWEPFSRVWVSNDRSDARSQLADEDALFLPGPASRSLRALVHNGRAALSLVRSRRPRVVITTGADIAVPFAWIARLYGARIVYVESFTRISRPSLTCRLIRPVASRVYAQWPELLDSLPNARYVGAVVESEPVVAP
jgi:UDP-N-acetylglucosamine:LPS N-acetylglucosamine transferase